jgi:hypothetical protein
MFTSLCSTIKGLTCVYRGAKGCYPRQNAVNDIRNLRKRIKLINLSKSRMKCLCAGTIYISTIVNDVIND